MVPNSLVVGTVTHNDECQGFSTAPGRKRPVVTWAVIIGEEQEAMLGKQWGWEGPQVTASLLMLSNLDGVFLFACLFIWLCLLRHGMWDLVPWPRIEPGPSALEAWSLSHQTSREVPRWGLDEALSAWGTFYSRSFCFDQQRICVWSLQLCLTLCDTMDYSLPGSSVHGILQARILEWSAVSSIFPTQGSNPYLLGLLHWQMDSLPLAPSSRQAYDVLWSLLIFPGIMVQWAWRAWDRPLLVPSLPFPLILVSLAQTCYLSCLCWLHRMKIMSLHWLLSRNKSSPLPVICLWLNTLCLL